MKTTILKTLCAAFILAHVMSVSAQETPQTPQKEKKSVEEVAAIQTETMVTDLGLTQEQTEKISEINLDFAGKIKAAKESQASEDELKTLYRSRERSLESSLNQEQLKNWKEIRNSKKQKENNRKN